jgi:hypothetical protein
MKFPRIARGPGTACAMKLFRGRWLPGAVMSAGLMMVLTNQALACACCADDGEYNFSPNARISEYQRAQFDGMKFGPAARLYLTDAGEDAVKGLASATPDNTVSVVLEPRQWRMTFRSADGKTGILTLPIPAKMTTLAADLHDSEDLRLGPSLYKEWRCEGAARGDGIFQKGFAAPARYTLIFQGRGNRCDSGSDFTHWRVEISGPKASYAFFGELLSESAPDESATPSPFDDAKPKE